MNLLFVSKLIKFASAHSSARKNLAAWQIIVKTAHWKKKQDVLIDFPKAKMIKNNRARFEILHNKFRLIVQINYEDQIVEIRFIGTHNEYEKIDPETI